MPAIVLQFLFRYVPLFGVSIAFMDYSPFGPFFANKLVGLKYFRQFWNDPRFWVVLRNTLKISLYDIGVGFFIPVIFALLLNEITNIKAKKITQTISYMPHFLSWVIVAGIFNRVLAGTPNGAVNHFLMTVFGNEKPISFLTDLNFFTGVLVFANIWQSTGWSAIIFIAALASIDSTLYEAAVLDGAGRLKQTWHVTLPSIAPTIILMFLLRIPGLFSVGFDRVFNMQNPAVVSSTDVISTYVYRLGIQSNQFSFASAIGLSQMLLSFILVLIFNKISQKTTQIGIY
jgi:putative aldouronate transport system permease protein